MSSRDDPANGSMAGPGLAEMLRASLAISGASLLLAGLAFGAYRAYVWLFPDGWPG